MHINTSIYIFYNHYYVHTFILQMKNPSVNLMSVSGCSYLNMCIIILLFILKLVYWWLLHKLCKLCCIICLCVFGCYKLLGLKQLFYSFDTQNEYPFHLRNFSRILSNVSQENLPDM